MDAAEGHVLAWRRNVARAAEYCAAFGADPAWEIVFLFYAGLHLTDAYLATKAARFAATNHSERKRAIKACRELPDRFRAAYESLQELSTSVRYEPRYVPRMVDHDSAKSHLKTVEQFLESKLRTRVPGAFP